MTERELTHLRSAEACRAAGEAMIQRGDEARAAHHFAAAGDEYQRFAQAVQLRLARTKR